MDWLDLLAVQGTLELLVTLKLFFLINKAPTIFAKNWDHKANFHKWFDASCGTVFNFQNQTDFLKNKSGITWANIFLFLWFPCGSDLIFRKAKVTIEGIGYHLIHTADSKKAFCGVGGWTNILPSVLVLSAGLLPPKSELVYWWKQRMRQKHVSASVCLFQNRLE